jgi:hypothetical protein
VGRRSWALALVMLLALTGCSSSSEPAVLAGATSFQQALARGDGHGACALLSSEARHRLEDGSRRACADALMGLALPAEDPRSAQVWGREAQVGLTTQVLFMAEFSDGWRVTGAGCSPRPDQPYACLVRA